MATVKLGTKAVGSVIKLNVSGTAKEFIVANQSSSGVGVILKEIWTTATWSTACGTSCTSFYNALDSDIQAAIISQSAGNVFLLSYDEANGGWSYFSSNSARIAYYSGSAYYWWLRTGCGGSYAYYVYTSGAIGSDYYYGIYNTLGVRPAFVLPSTLSVSDDGTVSTNEAPTVTSDTATGTDLGTKAEAFSLSYTVADTDGDSLTVTEKLDGVTCREVTNVTSGTEFTFAATATAAEWQKVLNGSHTLSVEVSDGTETTTYSVTFTKKVTSASITLETPLTVDGDITVATLAIAGSIPDDATLSVQVTNNANDDSPVWQDCTTEVQSSQNIVFNNTTAANGAAFNFKVSVSEGTSGTGGYITAVTGAFE